MKVKKLNSKVIHAGAEAWDGLHPYCDTETKGWRATYVTDPVSCKRCLRIIERVEAATREHEDEPMTLRARSTP